MGPAPKSLVTKTANSSQRPEAQRFKSRAWKPIEFALLLDAMKKRSCHTRVAAVTMHYAAMLLLAVLGVLPAAPAVAQSTDDSLRIYAVRVGDRYGVYLGNGLIITAAHVAGPRVRIADLDLPAKIIKSSPFEELDLALLSVDAQNLPVSQRLRRMPLCQRTPVVGAAVIVAIPEGTARSQIMSPKWLPAHMRTKFPTLIRDVATTGDSGSGVFDSEKKCLLGIMSRKITGGFNGGNRDLAKYFVPASTIRNFIPAEHRF